MTFGIFKPLSETTEKRCEKCCFFWSFLDFWFADSFSPEPTQKSKKKIRSESTEESFCLYFLFQSHPQNKTIPNKMLVNVLKECQVGKIQQSVSKKILPNVFRKKNINVFVTSFTSKFMFAYPLGSTNIA